MQQRPAEPPTYNADAVLVGSAVTQARACLRKNSHGKQGASKKGQKRTSSSAGMMTRAGKVVAAVALGAASGAAMGGIKGAITAGEKATGLAPNDEAGVDDMSGQDKQRSRTAPRRTRAAKGR